MGDDEDYVYDEASGEWRPASDVTAVAAVAVVDAEGNALADGDAVTLVKDLKVKGSSETIKRGTLVKNIRLTGDPAEIECNTKQVKGLVLRTEFVRKR